MSIKDKKKDKKDKKKDKKEKKGKKKRLARSADKYELYQQSVQEPDADLDFFVARFEERYKRKPTFLREDFCGTHFTSCAWVKRAPENRALGADLDPEPVAWGREHNQASLSEEEKSRLTILLQDVREPFAEKADMIAAQNFSFCLFKTREALRSYFASVRAGLKDEGIFVLDIFGGPEAQKQNTDLTKKEGFTYVWDQRRYNAITNEIFCTISFRFPDGSTLPNAFAYDWRLWTIAELRELLAEAGFSETGAYWEGADDEGEGNGEFTLEEQAIDDDDAWIAYVVATP